MIFRFTLAIYLLVTFTLLFVICLVIIFPVIVILILIAWLFVLRMVKKTNIKRY
jgi:hypothetical protein